MSKPNINKLKYPLWLNITFYLLTVLSPIILIMVEGFQAPDKNGGLIFKLTFSVLSIALVAWIFIKKFLINNIETKLIANQTALEHDYSIDCGNPDKIKYLWYQNEIKLTIFNMITVILYGALMSVILIGVAKALMQIKGIIILITIMYIIAYTIKFSYIIVKRNGDYNEQTT